MVPAKGEVVGALVHDELVGADFVAAGGALVGDHFAFEQRHGRFNEGVFGGGEAVVVGDASLDGALDGAGSVAKGDECKFAAGALAVDPAAQAHGFARVVAGEDICDSVEVAH